MEHLRSYISLLLLPCVLVVAFWKKEILKIEKWSKWVATWEVQNLGLFHCCHFSRHALLKPAMCEKKKRLRIEKRRNLEIPTFWSFGCCQKRHAQLEVATWQPLLFLHTASNPQNLQFRKVWWQCLPGCAFPATSVTVSFWRWFMKSIFSDNELNIPKDSFDKTEALGRENDTSQLTLPWSSGSKWQGEVRGVSTQN